MHLVAGSAVVVVEISNGEIPVNATRRRGGAYRERRNRRGGGAATEWRCTGDSEIAVDVSAT